MILKENAAVFQTRISISLRMIRESSRAKHITYTNEPEAVVKTGRQPYETGLRIASVKAAELLIRVFRTKLRLASPLSLARKAGD
jgi:hypothetical protein